MGDVFVPVKLAGVRADGNPRAKTAVFDALVDTGASRTVVSRAVALRLGIRPVASGGMSSAGGMVRMPVGAAFAMVRGCDAEVLMVGISDDVAEVAGAEVVLGHDYLQAVRMAVRPYKRTARCEGQRAARANPRRPARARRRAPGRFV